MRYFPICAYFLAITADAAAIFDPCYFVGLRIAKTHSICVDGVCKSLLTDPSSGNLKKSSGLVPSDGEAVSCSRAKEIRKRIYASYLEPVERKR